MPTSSQALILLSTDGQLPRYISKRKFPVSSIPYPIRSLDINAVSKDYEDSLSDYEPPFYDKSRHTRIRLDSISESLPELLTIRGYRGSLSFDPETKVLKWQVNTEIPKEKMYPQLSFKTNQMTDLDHCEKDISGAVRLPPLNIDRPRRLNDLQNMESPAFNDGPEVLIKKTEDLRRYFSLPKLFKATVDTDTYKRLCELGFRRPIHKEQKSEKRKKSQENAEKHVEFIEIPNQAWEADGTEDKDFRIEDLDLNPNSSRMRNIKISSSKQFPHLSKNEHFKSYFVERDSFFDKYNYDTLHKNTAQHSEEFLNMDSKEIKRRQKISLSEATLFPNSDMYITRKSKRNETHDSDSEKENVGQPLSLLEEVKERSNYNKWKKARITSIRLRKELPPSQPLAVSFSLPDNAKSHWEIKKLVETQIGTPITKLQFDPVAVHAIDSDAKSRWIVTLSDYESRDAILDSGLIVNGEKLAVRKYDDITRDEVQAYKIFELIQKGRTQNELNKQAKQKRRKSHAK